MKNKWAFKEIYKDELSIFNIKPSDVREELFFTFKVLMITYACLIWSFIKAALTVWIFRPTDVLKAAILRCFMSESDVNVFLDIPNDTNETAVYLTILFMLYLIQTICLVELNYYNVLFSKILRPIENIYLLMLKFRTRKLPLSEKEMGKLGIKTLYDWHLYLSKHYTRKLLYRWRITIDIPEFVQDAIKESTGYSIYFDCFQDCNIEKTLKNKAIIYTHYDKNTEQVYKDAIRELYSKIEI